MFIMTTNMDKCRVETMNHILKKTILYSGFLLSLLFSQIINALYWEISDSRLPYIARVRADPNWGVAILYNPEFCKEIGDACWFFKNHAWAHSARNHIILPPEAYPPTLEAEADCWAAKYSKSYEVYAAVQLFLDDGRNPNLNITGDPAERAEKVRACAIEAGNWIEEQ